MCFPISREGALTGFTTGFHLFGVLLISYSCRLESPGPKSLGRRKAVPFSTRDARLDGYPLEHVTGLESTKLCPPKNGIGP